MSAKIVTPNSAAIAEAAEIIKRGGLVAMPTETVYGLAADATNGEAVARVFEAKGRPSFNPLISHIADPKDIYALAEVNDKAKALINQFWPGPLTLILKRANTYISDLATAGLDTIAIRCPAHDTARALIEAAGVPLVAPSANVSGQVSSTTPMLVAKGLGERIDMILAGGACKIGLESSVIDVSGDTPILLRPGAITREDIESVIGEIEVGFHANEKKPKSPGLLQKHYAPSIPVRLNAVDIEKGEALLAFGTTKFMGVRGGGAASNLAETAVKNLSEKQDLYEAASNLFAMLNALDRPEHKSIAVMAIPNEGLGVAINNRLERAAASS